MTRDDIKWLYRCILGREPETEAVMDWMVQFFPTFADARRHLLMSEEFRLRQRSESGLIDSISALPDGTRRDYVLEKLILGDSPTVALPKMADDDGDAQAINLVEEIARRNRLNVLVGLGACGSVLKALLKASRADAAVAIHAVAVGPDATEPLDGFERAADDRRPRSLVSLPVAGEPLFEVLGTRGVAPDIVVLGADVPLAGLAGVAFEAVGQKGHVVLELGDPQRLAEARAFADTIQRDLIAVNDLGVISSLTWPIPIRYSPAPKRSVEKSGRLCVAAIVKNEARRVAGMLRSCAPVADGFVIVDTGSTDDTIDVIRSTLLDLAVPAELKQIAFKDFASARNAAIDAVDERFDWILMIDADEHLVEEDYGRLLELLNSDRDAWLLPRYNFVDADKHGEPAPYPDRQRRLFRNYADKRIRYFGAVHEVLIGVETWGIAPPNLEVLRGDAGGPHIHHMGQVERSTEEWEAKHAFYTRLGEL